MVKLTTTTKDELPINRSLRYGQMVHPLVPPCLWNPTELCASAGFPGRHWSTILSSIFYQKARNNSPLQTSFLAPGKGCRPLQENVVRLSITRSVFGNSLSSRPKLCSRLDASYSLAGQSPQHEGAGFNHHWLVCICWPRGGRILLLFPVRFGSLISSGTPAIGKLT